MLVVVDYGAGNLRSVAKALESLGAVVTVSTDPDSLSGADKILLPGVGAFGQAMDSLTSSGIAETLIRAVREGTRLLGICLGFQLLFDASEEAPGTPGLSLIPGCVRRFPEGGKVPHLGWNRVRQNPSPLWEGIPDEAWFYFAHSYVAHPRDDRCTLGTTQYIDSFPSAVSGHRCFGVQFHPEKSQRWGLKLLDNFIRL